MGGRGKGKGEREDCIRLKDGKSKKYQRTLWRPRFRETVVNEAEVATFKKALNS